MIRDPIPANWTIERRIYRFPPLEGERSRLGRDNLDRGAVLVASSHGAQGQGVTFLSIPFRFRFRSLRFCPLAENWSVRLRNRKTGKSCLSAKRLHNDSTNATRPLSPSSTRARTHARPRTRAVTFEIRSKEGRGNSDSCTPS